MTNYVEQKHPETVPAFPPRSFKPHFLPAASAALAQWPFSAPTTLSILFNHILPWEWVPSLAVTDLYQRGLSYSYLCISSTQMSRHTLEKQNPISVGVPGVCSSFSSVHTSVIFWFFFSSWHKDAPGLPCIFFLFLFSSLFFLSCLLLKPTISLRKADSFITVFRMQLLQVCSSLPRFHCS